VPGCDNRCPVTHGGLRFSAVDPRGFLAAVQFLTRIPVRRGDYNLADTVVWLPLVGALLGSALAGVDVGLRWWGASSLLTATLVVVLLLVLTGALHADGLMDTCDAVFGHASPERRLEIMRDPRTGAFGVVGLVCVIALKIAAVDGLSSSLRPGLLLLAPTLGRWSIVLLAATFPYGRASGLGAPLKAAATPRALAFASVVPVLACALLGPIGVLVGVLAAATAYGVGRWLLRLLPGLTGDCYGATCEVVETVVLVCGALVGH
jgi:adenosylcobinamide-GDP ribazoletransferase